MLHIVIKDNLGNTDVIEYNRKRTFDTLFDYYKITHSPKPNPINPNTYLIMTHVMYDSYLVLSEFTPKEIGMKDYDVLYFKNVPILTLGDGIKRWHNTAYDKKVTAANDKMKRDTICLGQIVSHEAGCTM